MKKIGLPKYSIQYQEVTYYLTRTNKGRNFVSNTLSEREVQQWIFQSKNQQTMIIIQKYPHRIDILFGQKLDNWLLQDQLQLNKLPQILLNNNS